MAVKIIFWVSIGGLSGIYAFYGIAIFLINKIRNKKPLTAPDAEFMPEVAVLIAAYDEEEVIAGKIENTLALRYPADKLKIYVVADGSTDRTAEIVSSYRDVTLLYEADRRGKCAAINRAMAFIHQPITILTDANVMINSDAIPAMVKHYTEARVGAVSGEKVVRLDDRASAASTEGVYWKYESFLKKQDALLYSLAGAAGELFSIRTALYEAIPEDTLLDDFTIAMNIIRKGYQVKYEPTAFASEAPSLNINEEYKRKVRIAAGGIQTIIRNRDILNPLVYSIFSFQFLIHRVSRWTVAPVFILTGFISNLLLIKDNTVYLVFFVAQLVFHLAALLGWILNMRQIKIKAFYIPFYFEFMHYCVIAGWIRFVRGNQKATWQKATRLSYN
jgi:biofilm PGA synthesis N-glycosyltransferase PgaC